MNILSDYEHHKRDEEWDAAEDRRIAREMAIYCYACGARQRHDCKCTRLEIPLPENDVD